MKKTMKITAVLLLIVMLITLNTFTFAINDVSYYNPGDLEANDIKVVGDVTSNILAYIRTFGILTSVIVASIIGLKYMFSSLEEKANYKENAVPYVVGIFLLASVTTLPSIIWDLAH